MGPALMAAAQAGVRHRWRSLIGLAVVVALTTSVVLVAAAGARRTGSAFDRLSDRSLARHVSVQVDDPELVEPVLSGVEALPEVEASGRVALFPVAPDPEQVASAELDLAVFASPDGGWGGEIDRGVLVAGRHPDPAAPLEVVLNELAADQTGLGPGDRLDVATFTPDDLDYVFSGQGFRGFNGPSLELEVVGVVRRAEDLQASGAGATPVAVGTPAFVERYGDQLGSLSGMAAFRLRGGEAQASLVAERVRELAGPGGEVFLTTASEDFGDGVRSAIEVLALSLWIFAGVAAGAGAVVVGGAVSRQVAAAGSEQSTFWALGMGRRARAVALAAPVALAAAAGGAAGALIAVAASPLMPIGLARRAEPASGLHLDAAVVAGGALLAVLLACAAALASASRPERRPSSPRAGARTGAARSAFGATVSVGLAHMTDRTSRRGAPMRSAATAAVLAVAGVVGAATVVSSVDGLAGSPYRYGWGWSAEPDIADGGVEAAVRSLAADDRLAGVGQAHSAAAELGGRPVNAMAVEVAAGHLAVPLRAGRAPASPGEVALGARTAAALGVGVGDTVDATAAGGEATVTLDVVGLALFRPADNPNPGDGALVTVEGLERIRRSEGFESILLRYPPGADPAELEAQLTESHPVGFSVYSYPRLPSNVDNLRGTRHVVRGLALFFAALGVAGLTHAVLVSVRRRRHDHAVLKALGFVGRQVRWTVHWQGLALAAAGLAVGVPAGLAAGRLVWRAMVGDLGLLDAPTNPLAVLAAAPPLGLLLASLGSFGPARWASHLRPGAVLRAE